ncbi:hypothetical protein F3Y22_tig00110419pilonHSYRG00024 [Hibiscus syriacus]|uniref:Piwi domain-containing protein n=1 Tax=Hibiscus syriacus TaxID=106335 RepID=A0A6A3AQT8_HIBSY|nr:hypothetical protein F3Y22_tig00110419pilonHSYRG00024 [Hibiscus syriacus]
MKLTRQLNRETEIDIKTPPNRVICQVNQRTLFCSDSQQDIRWKQMLKLDGVSEGQFSKLLLHEMDSIRKVFKGLSFVVSCSTVLFLGQSYASFGEKYSPPVTFVVVQKRHNSRLFPTNHNDRSKTDKSGNVLPGTVVDTKICHPTEEPASPPIIMSCMMKTGSVQTVCRRSPTIYVILPPAYYAHLDAFRARCYVEEEMSASGSMGGSRKPKDQNAEVRPLPSIKENVKEVMFYCRVNF